MPGRTSAPAQQGGSRVTATSYIQSGARWALYQNTRQRLSVGRRPSSTGWPTNWPARERRALQAYTQAARLAAQWETEIAFAKTPVLLRPSPAAFPHPMNAPYAQ